jgi:hypothetical protein
MNNPPKKIILRSLLLRRDLPTRGNTQDSASSRTLYTNSAGCRTESYETVAAA